MASLEKLKIYRKLESSKYRKKEKKLLVEGTNSVGIVKKYFPSSIIDIIEDEKELERVSKDNNGIVAIVDINKLDIKTINPDSRITVFCQEIQDPGNAGTIIRSCAALNVREVIFSKNSVDKFNPKVIRSSVGTVFQEEVKENMNLKEEILKLRKRGGIVIALDIKGTKSKQPISIKSEEVKAIFNEDKEIMFVFGNEARGLRDNQLELVDKVVFIPIHKEVESLNLATSVNIVLASLLG